MKAKDEFRVNGALCLCNWGGMGIQLSNDGEAVRYQWFNNPPCMRWIRVRWTMRGRAYFNARGRRWHLAEFMRV